VYPIPWILEIARFFAPIIAVAIVLKLIISLVWKTTRDLKLLGIKNHIVIWGLNAETNYLLENLLGNSSRIVLITSTHEMSDFPALKPARSQTVIFADEAESLSDKTRLCQKIHLESAKSVFVMTSDDANNIETVEKIEAYLDGCEKKRVALEARKTENINCELQVFVHIDDEHTMIS
jgi:voltage-gated potassium channel Kch